MSLHESNQSYVPRFDSISTLYAEIEERLEVGLGGVDNRLAVLNGAIEEQNLTIAKSEEVWQEKEAARGRVDAARSAVDPMAGVADALADALVPVVTR